MLSIFRQLIVVVALLLILVGIFGLSYTYRIDHRSARSLSAYATIDFRASYTGEGRLEGATLSCSTIATTVRSSCLTSSSTPTERRGR